MQVTIDTVQDNGVGIVIFQIWDDPINIPLYPSYLMENKLQNTI